MSVTSQPCFFIFGCPRSGTSLLSRVLDSHPELSVPFESHIYKMFWGQKHYYGDLSKTENQSALIKDILRTRIFDYWSPKPSYEKVFDSLQRQSLSNDSDQGFANVVDAIMRSSGEKSGMMWGEKTPDHIHYYAHIKRGFPQSKVLFIVRDGRDVASSLCSARFGPVTLSAASQYWVDYNQVLSKVEKSCGENMSLTIKYEDLVENSEAVLKKVCEYLGVEYSDSMLEFYKKEEVYPTDKVNISNLNSPVRKENAIKWPSKLTTQQVCEIEAVAAPTLERLGYPLSLCDSDSRKAIERTFVKKQYSWLLHQLSRLKDFQGQREFINLRMIRYSRRLKYYFSRYAN